MAKKIQTGRYGVDGLKDIPKSGRPTELSLDVEYKMRTILKASNQGWTTKQIEELIVQQTGFRYHPNHIYRIVKKWGFKQKIPPRKVHVNTASAEEKEEFKKRSNKYLWVSNTNITTKNKRKRKRKSMI